MGDSRKNRKSRGRKGGTLVGLTLLAAAALPGAPAALAQNINCFQSIIFGSAVACPGTGTITLTPAGTRSTTGCLNVSGPSSRGRCLLIGSFFPVRPMQVSITAASYALTNGTSNMNMDNFNLVTTGGGPTATLTAFITVVDIGTTLNVGANQPSGTYTGAATVNVNFQ